VELTDALAHVGWQCRNPDFCPVTELSRVHFTSLNIGVMLKIDWDAPFYSNNGEEYLQIMVAEVADATVVPLDATNGIFMSFEIASIIPATCLDTSIASYFIFNTQGGGGNRDGVETEDYTSYVMALEN